MSSSVRHRAVAISAALVALALLLVPLAPADAATKRGSIGAGLEGPSGLHASVYAKGLEHVAAFATDAQERVWVATAAASDQGKDAIYLIDDDGATHKVVADVHTPLGLVWVGDTLYVAGKDQVLALSGFDGSAFTTSTAAVTFPDGTGELNGLALGADGRLHLGISASCDSCTPTDGWSASVVSFLPDGSDLQVDASGIRAPVGLAFAPGGTDLYVSMNQRDDLGKKTPADWLALVKSGEAWGFPSCYGQGGSACTGVPAPVAQLDKHAAASGVAVVSGQLGSSVGTGVVVAEWTTGKVLLSPLAATSGTAVKATTLLTGFENPVAVMLTPSGALFVGDWTSGKIYRISS